MRPNTNNNRRSRGRGGRKSGNTRNQTFDSNGPGARVRGNASQIYEKYQQLARDAGSSSDRVGAENFLQHAEHYYRLMIANGPKPEPRNGVDGSQRDESDGNGGEAQVEMAAAPSRDPEPSDEETNSDSAVETQSHAESGDGNGAKPNGRKRRQRKPRVEQSDSDAVPAADGDSGEEAEVSPA
jgi:hypothetical protein